MIQKRIKWISISCVLIGIVGLAVVCINQLSVNKDSIFADDIKEIYLPKMNKKPAALDLKSGRLVDIQCTGEGDWYNPDFARAVKELKNGDLIFELSHLALITDKYKAVPPEDYTVWPTWHKIPRFLPYAMIITTDNGQSYNINVLEKTDDGVSLLYRRTTKNASPEMLLAEHRDQQLLKRLLSANMMNDLDRALSIYAGNWADKLPRTLEKLEYFSEQDIGWINENVEYSYHVKNLAVAEKTVLAYDKTLLNDPASDGTNVLYNDSKIIFLKKEELEQLGIK